MQKKTVLIIDDEEPLTLLISWVVENCGYEAVTFRNGTDGLTWLETGNHADLLLLDVMMPVMTGIEMIREMKRRGLLGTTPVILLTGVSDEKLILQGFEAGAKDYLLKPFILEELKKQVTKYVTS